MGADPTREAALALVEAVLDRRQTLDIGLDGLHKTSPRDRAAAHRLAAATLRHLGTLDAVLDPYLRRAPPTPVRHILRLGAAGLLFADTAPHAAVTTAVALARARGLEGHSGLVNAILRRVADQGTNILADLDSPRLDTPAWLWTAWGPDARAIATAHAQEAPLDLTLAPSAPPPPDAQALPTGSWRLPPATSVTGLPGYDSGAFWVQDAAAALPVHLLAPRAGERIADLCAAPGGKTAQLIAAGAHVTAVEHNPQRLTRLAENLRRLRMTADLVEADVTTWSPPQPFDAILLDAPCSATGTIRRHPDIPHLRRPRDLATLTGRQDHLLAAAAAMLRPGGRLIYAVCSLQPEESAKRLAAARLRHAPFLPHELEGLPQAITADGVLRTHPGMWPDTGGLDGFFAARLVRDR